MSLNGSGTESSPFLVSTWDQLKEALEYDNENFNENNLKYVSLNNNIDITTEKKRLDGSRRTNKNYKLYKNYG